MRIAHTSCAVIRRSARFRSPQKPHQCWLAKRSQLLAPVAPLSRSLSTVLLLSLTMVMLFTVEVIDEDDLWDSVLDAAEKRAAAADTKREQTATTLTVKVEEESASGFSVSPIASEDEI
jgi:hypothetical protein